VDHAALVGRLQRLGDLQRGPQRLLTGHRAARKLLGEIFALDELHGQEARAPVLMDAIDAGDVRMVERGEEPRLALEAGQPVGIAGEEVRQQLDRDLAVQRGVHRLPDGPHPPLADLLGEPVVQQRFLGCVSHPRILPLVRPIGNPWVVRNFTDSPGRSSLRRLRPIRTSRRSRVPMG